MENEVKFKPPAKLLADAISKYFLPVYVKQLEEDAKNATRLNEINEKYANEDENKETLDQKVSDETEEVAKVRRNNMITNFDELPAILTADDIQAIFRLKRDATYRLLRSKDFPSFKVGGAVRVYKAKLIEYIERQLSDGGT